MTYDLSLRPFGIPITDNLTKIEPDERIELSLSQHRLFKSANRVDILPYFSSPNLALSGCLYCLSQSELGFFCLSINSATVYFINKICNLLCCGVANFDVHLRSPYFTPDRQSPRSHSINYLNAKNHLAKTSSHLNLCIAFLHLYESSI